MMEKGLEISAARPELALFAARLRTLVGLMPVARFARECGLTESVFRGYMEGRVEPGMLALKKIGRYKGVSVDRLCADAMDGEVPGGYVLAPPTPQMAPRCVWGVRAYGGYRVRRL